METATALLAHYKGNSTVVGEFPSQRPVTRNFDAFFDLCLNKRLSKLGDLRHHCAHYDATVMRQGFEKAYIYAYISQAILGGQIYRIAKRLHCIR